MVNVTFLAVKNKEKMCAWCIQSVNWETIAMVDAFSSQNARKRYKQHSYRHGNNKQGTVDVFRCQHANEKIAS